MKKTNEELIKKTEQFSKQTLTKSDELVEKWTHPSAEVNRKGSIIGLIVGIILFMIGVVLLFTGKVWEIIGCVIGVGTVISYVIRKRKT